MLIKYKFNEVSVGGGGKVGASLQKLADFSIFDKGIPVWESEQGCRDIFQSAQQASPQTRKARYIQAEMTKALNAIAAYKREHEIK